MFDYSQMLRHSTGIASALGGVGNFGGYSSAAMQQYQTGLYQQMMYRKYKKTVTGWDRQQWATATASGGIMPEYGVYGPNAYQCAKPVEPEKVETVPPQMYITKRLNWIGFGWVCAALILTMIPVAAMALPPMAAHAAAVHHASRSLAEPKFQVTDHFWRYFKIKLKDGDTVFAVGEHFVKDEGGNLEIKTDREMVYQVPYASVAEFTEVDWVHFPRTHCRNV